MPYRGMEASFQSYLTGLVILVLFLGGNDNYHVTPYNYIKYNLYV